MEYLIGTAPLDSGQKLILLLGGLGLVAGVLAGFVGFLVFGLTPPKHDSEAH